MRPLARRLPPDRAGRLPAKTLSRLRAVRTLSQLKLERDGRCDAKSVLCWLGVMMLKALLSTLVLLLAFGAAARAQPCCNEASPCYEDAAPCCDE